MYFSSKSSFSDISKMCLTFFCNESDIHKKSSKSLVLCRESFTLNITTGGQGVKFASEDYGSQYQHCCWFEIISSHPNWAEELMNFVNFMLAKNGGDCVLQSNGERPVMLKKSGKVYIDNSIGDGSFPFHLIREPYSHKILWDTEKGVIVNHSDW